METIIRELRKINMLTESEEKTALASIPGSYHWSKITCSSRSQCTETGETAEPLCRAWVHIDSISTRTACFHHLVKTLHNIFSHIFTKCETSLITFYTKTFSVAPFATVCLADVLSICQSWQPRDIMAWLVKADSAPACHSIESWFYPFVLCGFGQVILQSRASVSSSVQWGS